MRNDSMMLSLTVTQTGDVQCLNPETGVVIFTISSEDGGVLWCEEAAEKNLITRFGRGPTSLRELLVEAWGLVGEQSVVNCQEFTQGDWDCFAGAERFADGTEPMIATHRNGWTVLVDRDTIQVMPIAGEQRCWCRPHTNPDLMTQKKAKTLIERIPWGDQVWLDLAGWTLILE